MVRKKQPSSDLLPENACQDKNRMIAVGAHVRQCIWKPTARRGRAICEYGRPSYKPLPPIVGAKVFDSTKRTAPAYSFGRKTISRRTGFDDGPAKFDVSGMSNRGFYKKAGIAMKSRRVELKPFANPGAGNYTVDKAFAMTTKTIPRYSFGKKPQQLKPFMTPAPNVYNLPPVVGTAKEGNKKAAPAFTMLGREKPRKLTSFIYPGPGDYEDKSDCERKRPPKYTMRPQVKVFDDSINKPGPNAHYAELYHKHRSVPAPSFSIHHTPCLGVRKAYHMPDSRNPVKCNQYVGVNKSKF